VKIDLITNPNDEFYTPQYAIDPILKYIPKEAHVTCPFDTDESLFVKSFLSRGNRVSHSHITTGADFFSMETPDTDYIVSNPPYSVKGEVLAKLFSMEKPFAMLLGVVGLFESQRRFEMFRDNDFEIMYLNRRVSYFRDYKDKRPALNPPFSSVYICHKVLPKQIVFEEIDKSNCK